MNTNNGVDYVSAPADFDDLYRIYYRYVVALVRRQGISPEKCEDTAQDVLLRFYERGMLQEFDPTRVFVYNGRERKARFKQFLTKFVLAYMPGYRDKERNLARREQLLCDTLVGDEKEDTWLEMFGTTDAGFEEEVIAMLDEATLVEQLRHHLAQVPRRSRSDVCDLPALFDAVVAQVRQNGEVNVSKLQPQFGVSVAALHSWVWWMKANLCQITGYPMPAKRQQKSRKTITAEGSAAA